MEQMDQGVRRGDSWTAIKEPHTLAVDGLR